MRTRPDSGCLCPPGRSACIRPTHAAARCLPVRTTSATPPKDETISLHIGNAFDIVAERKQTDYKRLSDRLYEFEYEITLRNHKDMPITVEVNEPIGGDWEMVISTYKFTKTAAFAAQFQAPVEKDGTSVLRYRVRVRY